MDEFFNTLEEKFIKHSKLLQPFQLLVTTDKNNESEIRKKIKMLTPFYDLEENIMGEIILWHQFLIISDKKKQTLNALETLSLRNKSLFSGAHVLQTILATLPTTTCSNERTFLPLRILKYFLRNSMSEDWLKGLALMYSQQKKENVTP